MRRLQIAVAALALALPSVAVAQTTKMAHFVKQRSGSIPSASGLFSIAVTSAATDAGGYMMLFAGRTPPPDGAVDPVACFYVDEGPGTSSLSMGMLAGSAPDGISWAFSLGPDCQAKVSAAISFVSIAYR